MNWLCTTLSQTFDKTGKSEIGLSLFASSWFSVFRERCYFSKFPSGGKCAWVLIEVSIIDVITGRILTRQSFKTRTEILSIPGLCLIALMIFCVRTTAHGIQIKLLAHRVFSWNEIILVECYVAFISQWLYFVNRALANRNEKPIKLICNSFVIFAENLLGYGFFRDFVTYC